MVNHVERQQLNRERREKVVRLREEGMLYREIGKIVNRTPSRVGQILHCRKVEDLNLSIRAWYSLRNAKINHVWALLRCSEADLLRLPNMGRKSTNEVKKVMAKMGYVLRK